MLLSALRELGQAAEARYGEIDALGRLPEDLVAGLLATGILRAWVAAPYGGEELPLLEGLRALEELSYWESSTGWCAMIGATTALLSGRLPPEWAQQIYGDPRSCTGGYALSGGSARAVPGGLAVSGRWPWGSGTYHCTWIGGGCRVVDEGGKPSRLPDGAQTPFVFFRSEEVELLDTWDPVGLRGTGSTDYRVASAFVPEGRWVEFPDGPAQVSSPLYRFPLLGALALGVCTVALGAARRARDELVSLAGQKRPTQSAHLLAQRPVVQAQVAEAEAALRAAWSYIREVVEEVMLELGAGRELVAQRENGIRLAATHATRTAARVATRMYEAGGGSSVHRASPLARAFRDAHVITQHGIVSPRTLEAIGRRFLRVSPDGRGGHSVE